MSAHCQSLSCLFKVITSANPSIIISEAIEEERVNQASFVPFQFRTVEVLYREVSSRWMFRPGGFRPIYMFIYVFLKYDTEEIITFY